MKQEINGFLTTTFYADDGAKLAEFPADEGVCAARFRDLIERNFCNAAAKLNNPAERKHMVVTLKVVASDEMGRLPMHFDIDLYHGELRKIAHLLNRGELTPTNAYVRWVAELSRLNARLDTETLLAIQRMFAIDGVRYCNQCGKRLSMLEYRFCDPCADGVCRG